mgnify:CR=1 FL=1
MELQCPTAADAVLLAGALVTNTVLTKEYHMKCEPSEDDPFSFEGPEIYKCTGCAVNWKQGKNLTVKTVKKKQKGGGAKKQKKAAAEAAAWKAEAQNDPPEPDDDEFTCWAPDVDAPPVQLEVAREPIMDHGLWPMAHGQRPLASIAP